MAVRWLRLFSALVFFGLLSCQALTAEEARQALEEVTLSSQALSLASGSVEIATDFTIGDAVEAAAEEVREFIETQLPCAEVTLTGATLSIVYGALPGDCFYNGRRYKGMHTITIVSAAVGKLEVHHEWTNLENNQVSVSGTADVTWSSADSSRHVVHELTWKELPGGETVVGGGDRTQTVLQGGLLEGIRVDGNRDWTSESGDWDLEINAVEARWIDPVPQSGSYTLDTPFNKTVEMSFSRVDEDTIEVTVGSGRQSFSFNVSKSGMIT
ncbi:MAG: hypothetical protein GY854_31980 [Deltaproteobacteria bacterium]|nr:hypothetical protein [Deltaproteobacteria bacterium]